jgi:hypothetical protein
MPIAGTPPGLDRHGRGRCDLDSGLLELRDALVEFGFAHGNPLVCSLQVVLAFDERRSGMLGIGHFPLQGFDLAEQLGLPGLELCDAFVAHRTVGIFVGVALGCLGFDLLAQTLEFVMERFDALLTLGDDTAEAIELSQGGCGLIGGLPACDLGVLELGDPLIALGELITNGSQFVLESGQGFGCIIIGSGACFELCDAGME